MTRDQDLTKLLIEVAGKLPPEFRGSINSDLVDPITCCSKIDPEDLMGIPYLEDINPQDYRRMSPLAKRGIRSKIYKTSGPCGAEIFSQEIPAADPEVEKMLISFIKRKTYVRKVFSGWWVE